MQYLDNTTYQNLNSKIKSFKWVIYLPTKPGPDQTYANYSLCHHAIATLKKTLKDNNTNRTAIKTTVDNLRINSYKLKNVLKGNGTAIFINNKSGSEFYDLPFQLNDGFITDLPELFLKPIQNFFNDTKSYYFIDLHKNNSTIYNLVKNKLKPISTTSGSLYQIDKNITVKLHVEYKPIVLIGSEKLAHAYKKISHNKRQIIGYMSDLPSILNLQNINNKLVKL